MAVKLTQHCTHGDKVYESGEIVKNAKIEKILIAAGVAEDVKKDADKDAE